MKDRPPLWLSKFLRWYCDEELVDGIEGDLYELYARRLKSLGRLRANFLFMWNVLLFFQPFTLKRKREHNGLRKLDMLQNHFKIAKRSLGKSKLITAINVFGLSLGISSFLLIMSYVIQELSYEKDFTNHDRIFRLFYAYDANGKTTQVAKTAFPLKYHILENYTEVERIIRFYINRMDVPTLRYGDKMFTEEKIFFTDPEVFQVFDFEWISGNPEHALSEKNSIVLTSEMAVKYFGDENPIGKIVEFKNSDQLEVKGILKTRGKSHLDFDFLVPVELQRQRWKGDASNNGYDLEDDWKWSGCWMYIMLKDESLRVAFDRKISEDGIDFFGRLKGKGIDYRFQSQPIVDIHLRSDLAGEISANASEKQVFGFIAVAILILVVACINFVNLTTAQSGDRAMEIGLRKVMGAYRSHLIGQFLTESVLVALLSAFLGLMLLEIMLPYFNDFMNTEVVVPYFSQPKNLILILAGVLGIGIFSGLYPSFYLSRFKPVMTLKGNKATGRSSHAGLRKTLVIGQFIVSNTLIIGIIVIELQLDFIKNKNLGFDKDQVIILDHGSKVDDDFETFRNMLKIDSRIEGVNLGYVPGTGGWTQSFRVEGEDLQESKGMGFKHVSYDFLELFDMEMVAGRNFSKEFITDQEQAILLNEAAIRNFGWTPDEALGKTFSYIGGSDNKTRYVTKVIGVMKDANLESLYEPVRPSVFKLSDWGDVSIKFKNVNGSELISAIGFVEEKWKELSPQWPFEFSFLDQQIEEQYQREERLSKAIKFFGMLSILIACMGLFGLASFTVKKKTKEIGVRKVLGASVASIVYVVSRSFLALMVFAFAISIPFGYYLSSSWLQDFEYQVSIDFWIFLFAGVLSVFISAIAIAGQSMKAAQLDPVHTLRYE